MIWRYQLEKVMSQRAAEPRIGTDRNLCNQVIKWRLISLTNACHLEKLHKQL